MAQSQNRFFAPPTKVADDQDALQLFYRNISPGQQVLMVVGGGTAALTYLYTHDIEPQYTHIVILGDRGYWETAAHRLAQPQHILALPHAPSDEFIDPADHDEKNGILPHESRSAYVYSRDFQARLCELEKATVESLNQKGKKVFIARNERVNKIERHDALSFKLELNQRKLPIFANKVVVASGAGPSRKLSPDLYSPNPEVTPANNGTKAPFKAEDRILTYTDVLTSVAEKCRNKNVLIYGGGATAAWAMEVAALTAKPQAWVAKSGFDKAVNAGPRVNAIIKKSQSIQIHGKIDTISCHNCPVTGEPKLLIMVTSTSSAGTTQTKYVVDYLFNCIGQEQYELGGLPEVISEDIRKELIPHLDKNYVTGTDQSCMLGWTTKKEDFVIIGAAQGTYYDKDRKITRPSVVSKFLPRSGQVPITIGAVISSVCAFTNYMPVSQETNTGKCFLTSLNVNIMNATQLAVYFTASYPQASPVMVNNAVASFISERAQTEFGLCSQQIEKFMETYFGQLKEAGSCEITGRQKPK